MAGLIVAILVGLASLGVLAVSRFLERTYGRSRKRIRTPHRPKADLD
jgi:hypothetical protein